MSEQEWFRPQDKMPPENVVVDTLNLHGQMTQLKIMRGLTNVLETDF